MAKPKVTGQRSVAMPSRSILNARQQKAADALKRTVIGSGDILGGHVDIDRARQGGYSQSLYGAQPTSLRYATSSPREKDSGNQSTGPRGTARRINALNSPAPNTANLQLRIPNHAPLTAINPNLLLTMYNQANGTFEPLSTDNPNGYVPGLTEYENAVNYLALQVNDSTNGLPMQVNAAVMDAWNRLNGNGSKPAMTTSQFLDQQRKVGGTKGSSGIVDRSEAVKLAWETRRKRYGSSGQKNK